MRTCFTGAKIEIISKYMIKILIFLLIYICKKYSHIQQIEPFSVLYYRACVHTVFR